MSSQLFTEIPRLYNMKSIQLLLSTFIAFACTPYGFAQNGVHYIENKGQFPSQVDFKANLQNGAVFLEGTRMTFAFQNADDIAHIHEHHHDAEELDLSEASELTIGMHAYTTQFIQANEQVAHHSENEQPGIYNYFIGNDASKWASHVHRYEVVTYVDLYNGVDLKLYSSEEHFKYDFVVRPKADPSLIQFNYQGLDGLSIEKGNLILQTSVGNLIEQAPYAYQVIDGKTIQVDCQYRLENGIVTFELGNYAKKHALIIDPVLVAATYSGSTAMNFGHSACFDNNGNIFTGARSFGVGYPTTVGAYQVNFGGGGVDIAVSKLNPDGSSLIYATYLGGSNSEYPHSMVTNANGELYVLGSTGSTDYPTSSGTYDNSLGGAQDMVVTHLSADGSTLMGSTYMGGSFSDGANSVTFNYGDGFRGEIIVNATDDCFVVSSTESADFPTSSGAYQTSLSGTSDAVIFSLSPDMSTLHWSTYIGSSANDAGFGLRLDAAGDVYACGASTGAIPGIAGYQTTNQGGTDGFIVHISGDGTQLIHGSMWGTASDDNAFFLDLNSTGEVVFYGQSSGSIPVTAGTYNDAGSPQYIAKLSSDLTTVGFSTVIGLVNFVPIAFMVDNCGYIYFSGHSAGAGAPTTAGAIQTTGGFYIGVLEPGATGLFYGTYYGGNGDHVDGGTSRFDPSGVVYQGVCTGGGFSATANAWANSGSSWDIAVFKIDFEVPASELQITVDDVIACGTPPYDVTFASTATPNGTYNWNFGDGGSSNQQNPVHQYLATGQYDIELIVIDSTGCSIVDTAYASVTIIEPEVFAADWDIVPPPPCSNAVLLDVNFTGSGADSLIWDLDGSTLINQMQVTQLYDQPGTYTVSLIAYDFDCSLIDTLMETFTVSENTNYGTILMPNVFTPNDDGNNELYKPKYASNITEDVFENLASYEIVIMNRWGQEVFRSGPKPTDWAWDGKINGKEATVGVYYYLVRYEPYCNEVVEGEDPITEEHGFLHVLK